MTHTIRIINDVRKNRRRYDSDGKGLIYQMSRIGLTTKINLGSESGSEFVLLVGALAWCSGCLYILCACINDVYANSARNRELMTYVRTIKVFFTLEYPILQGLEGRYRTFMLPAGIRYAVNPLALSPPSHDLLPPTYLINSRPTQMPRCALIIMNEVAYIKGVLILVLCTCTHGVLLKKSPT